MTVQQLVNASLEAMGRSWPGYTPGASESAECLAYLNRVIDSFNTQRCYVCGLDTVPVAVTSGTAKYTLATRPVHIERAEFLITSGGLAESVPVKVMGVEEFNAIPQQGDVTPFVAGLYCDYAFPAANVSLAPTPAAGALKLYTWQLIAAFAALTDTVTVPPGILRALIHALAVELCGPFRIEITSALATAATTTKAGMESLNFSHVYGVPMPGGGK
jgi:hypothetical protein